MVDLFEERAKLRSGGKESGDIFEQRASIYKKTKSQEPLTLKGSAGTYGGAVLGGAGGIAGDFAPLLGLLSEYLFPGPVKSEVLGLKTTPELTQSISKEMGVEEPRNALERILRQSGTFGGQEALLGTALGGPVGGGLGLAHGSASGALYGGLKELGMDDEWALGITALATLSPIAAQKLITRFKRGSSFKEAAKSVEKEFIQDSNEPPGSSPDTFVGKEIPAGRQGYELAEEALGELQKPMETPKPEKIKFQFPENQTEKSPSLQGRVSRETEIEAPSTSAVKLPKEEAKPLTGRAKIISSEVESVISPNKFYNEKHGGINLSENAKKELEKENEIVRKKYKIAEKVYRGKNDIVPSLASKVEDALEGLSKTAEPSTAEKAVIKQLESLQKIIGTSLEPIEVGMDRLIKTADSMSQLLNYEVPGGGAKNILKSFVKSINNTVIETLEKQGVKTSPIKEADKAYSEMANRFFNDEIKGFIEKTIRNPESLYRTAIKDEGVYRAVRDALGKTHSKSTNKLERDIVESAIQPFVKDLQKVGSKGYEKVMRHLEGLIGEEKANKIRSRLDQWKRLRDKVVVPKSEKSFPKERITSSTKNIPSKQLSIAKKIPKDLETKLGMPEGKVTYPSQASKYLGETPSKIEKMMETREEIRKLKNDLSKKGLSKLFDKIAEEKTVEILRGGTVGPKKLKGYDVYEELIKSKNYDILSEIYGKEATDLAIEETRKMANKQLKITMFKELAKLGATVSGASKLYKVIAILARGL